MAARNPSLGSQKLVLYTEAGVLYATINAQSATDITGSFANMAAFSFTQTDIAVRSLLQDMYVKTDTSPLTLSYEDATEDELYLGAGTARAAGKVLDFYWYGSEIVGSTKRVCIYGKCFLSGDTGNMGTSAGAAASSPIQLFPVQCLVETTFEDWDATLVTETTQTLEVGLATKEVQLTVAS